MSTEIQRCNWSSKKISPDIASQFPSNAVPINSPSPLITGEPGVISGDIVVRDEVHHQITILIRIAAVIFGIVQLLKFRRHDKLIVIRIFLLHHTFDGRHVIIVNASCGSYEPTTPQVIRGVEFASGAKVLFGIAWRKPSVNRR